MFEIKTVILGTEVKCVAQLGSRTAQITNLQTETPHAETTKDKAMQIEEIILIIDIQVRDFKVWKHFTSGLHDLAG